MPLMVNVLFDKVKLEMKHRISLSQRLLVKLDRK